MPLVDDQGKVIDLTQPWALQTQQQQDWTVSLIEGHRPEMEEEYGKGFRYERHAAGRVIIYPETEEPLVAYLSDPGAEPWLVVDDFTPELWPEWWEPTTKPRKPKDLGAL